MKRPPSSPTPVVTSEPATLPAPKPKVRIKILKISKSDRRIHRFQSELYNRLRKKIGHKGAMEIAGLAYHAVRDERAGANATKAKRESREDQIRNVILQLWAGADAPPLPGTHEEIRKQVNQKLRSGGHRAVPARTFQRHFPLYKIKKDVQAGM